MKKPSKENGVARRGFLQASSYRLRRWLPTLTVLWALAATVGVLQPCQEAFAAGLSHAHGVQLASDGHPHRHTQGANGHHGNTQPTCQCAELAPPFNATALADTPLPPSPDGAITAAPDRARHATKARTASIAAQLPPGPATYLATNRLRI